MKIDDSLRLRFDLMSEADADLMFELDQDPEVMRYITDGRVTTREEIDTTYLPRLKRYTSHKNGWGLWKIIVIQSDEFIGWVLVRPMDFFTDQRNDRNLELGWRLKRSAWGNGYATEAARAIMSGLELNGVCNQFSAIANHGNDASINVMKKLGMDYVKTYVYRDPIGDAEVVYYRRDCEGSHASGQ